MAFVAPLIPYITAAGAAYQGAQAKNSADYNAKVMGVEARVSGMQANEATNTQLRQGQVFQGRSTAAAVESGGGVGGSTGAVLHQNAVNQELDALNVRYAGVLRSASFNEQAANDTAEGKQAMAGAFLSGAGSFLKQKYGASTGTYSFGGS